MDVDKIIKNANSIKEIVGDGCTAICNAVDELISRVTNVSQEYEKVDHIYTGGTYKSYYYYDFVKNTVCKFSYDGLPQHQYTEHICLPKSDYILYRPGADVNELRGKHLTSIYFAVDQVIAGTAVWNPMNCDAVSTHLLLYNYGHKAAIAPDLYDTFDLWHSKMFTRSVEDNSPVQLVRAYIKTIDGDKVELQVQEDGETIKLVPWSDKWTNSPVFKKFENF